MKIKYLTLFVLIFSLISLPLNAAKTKRIPQFQNAKVAVWKTIIYPNSKQMLPMHRHDYDRVLVALTSGMLKITNDQGKVKYFKLEKNKAYFLKRDPGHELHKDENLSSHPIQVMVIELKGKDKPTHGYA